MKIKEAIKILERHNKWRRGAEMPMENPEKLGEAIDVAIRNLKSLIDPYKTCPQCGRRFTETEVPSGKFCCTACENGY